MEKKNMAIGPIIGLVVILGVIILGGYYFLSTRSDTSTYGANDNSSATNTAAVENSANDQKLQQTNTQGNTTDTTSIKADIEATDVNSIDSDASAIQ